VAFAWTAVPTTAFAYTVYDGDWSVLILPVAALANRPFGMASRSLTEWSSTVAASPRCKDGSPEAAR
jgi:hypothetical protein